MTINNDRNGSGRNNTCPTPAGIEQLSIHGTVHFPMYLIAASCALITLLSSFTLAFLHLTRYRAPKEQRQIIRIIFAPFVFALVAWAEIARYSIAAYIDPIGDVYESVCLCALFLLYIQFAAPKGTFGEQMFQAMEEATTEVEGDSWAKMSWISVFQFPLTELLSVVILEATEATGTYCSSSLKPRFGHLWVIIIKTVGVLLAVMAIFRFYKRMKGVMKARRGLAKLVCFKGIVLLRFLQTWIFSILINKDAIHHSKQLSYADLLYGLPNVLLAVEMVLFSASFWYAYSASEYSSASKPQDTSLGFLSAVVDALNPSDLLLGITRMFSVFSGIRYASLSNQHDLNVSSNGKYDGSYTGGAGEDCYGLVGDGRGSRGGRRHRRGWY